MFEQKVHKFTMSVSVINNTTNEYKNLDKSIIAVAIKKNFLAFAFPLYVLNFNITEEDKRYLISNDVDISLSINRYTVDETVSSDQETNTNDPIIDKNIVNIILHPFDKDKSYSIPDTSEVENNETANNLDSQKTNYTLNCIPKENLLYNSTITNDCFANANLNEVLLNIISNLYTKNIYLQESKNVTRYDSLLVPPLSLVQAIKYLQDEFSIYDNGINIFFDLYVYDIKEQSREYKNNFSVNVVKTDETADKTIYQHAQVDENENVRFYLKNNPSYASSRDVFKDMIGSQTVFNSYDDNFNLVTRTYKTDNSIDKTRYFWNTKKMSYFENSEINKFCQYIQLKLNNIDPTLFEPSTQITVAGSTLEEINGVYSLIGSSIYYSTTDYVNFSEAVVLSLGKL